VIIEVDQSNKIERTGKDTVIGIGTKKKRFAAIVSRKIKRRLQIEFREAGQPRLFVYRTFIAAVVLTLQYSTWKNISDVVIDIEYSGHERRLRSIFLEMWARFSDSIPEVSFRLIGRQSPAHDACYEVTIGKRRADKVLNLGELKYLVF
jgi:hypothetical protein